jgi:hypothetical protein
MAVTEVVDTIGGVLKEIIGDNEAKVTYNDVLANAVPKGVEPSTLSANRWTTLELDYTGKWKGWPDSKATVKVRFAHSARHKGGGAFIPSVICWVEKPDMAPKSKLNVTFQASPPYTIGEKATNAVLPVRIEILENGLVGQIQDIRQYILYGSGHLEQA